VRRWERHHGFLRVLPWTTTILYALLSFHIYYIRSGIKYAQIITSQAYRLTPRFACPCVKGFLW
jgi:hypothetical protein